MLSGGASATEDGMAGDYEARWAKRNESSLEISDRWFEQTLKHHSPRRGHLSALHAAQWDEYREECRPTRMGYAVCCMKTSSVSEIFQYHDQIFGFIFCNEVPLFISLRFEIAPSDTSLCHGMAG